MIEMEEKERLISDVMDNFNFDTVLEVMNTLNWTWADENGNLSIPDMSTLKWRAEGLLDTVMEFYGTDQFCSSSCGGFKATLTHKGELILEFIAEECERV